MKDEELDFEKDFETQMMDAGRAMNLLCAAYFCLHTVFLSGIFLTVEQRHFTLFVILVVAIVFFAQFFVAPRTNHLLTKRISGELERYSKGELSTQERTALAEQLLSCPRRISVQVVLVFGTCVLVALCIVIFKFRVQIDVLLYIIFACILGIYNAGIQGFFYAENLCSKKIIDLMISGIDLDRIHGFLKDRLSIGKKIWRFCVIPFFLFALMQIFYAKMIYSSGWKMHNAVLCFTVAVFLNLLFEILNSAHIQMQITGATDKIINILENLTLKKQINSFTPPELVNEFSYNIFLIYEFVSKLHEISFDAVSTGEQIAGFTQRLLSSSNENVKGSVLESDAIVACLDTMEAAKELHESFYEKIEALSQTSFEAKHNADLTSSLLAFGTNEMNEITQANFDMISGIKNLEGKIDLIWRVADKMDFISEKIRTFAFNSDFKVSAAGKNAEKFRVVSNEVLRLSSAITSSTAEIRAKTKEIIHACDNLIVSSEGETQKTNDGKDFYFHLEAKFKELNLFCDIMSESLKKISGISELQSNVFERLAKMLSVVNDGFERFSASSQEIREEASTLNETSEKLAFTPKTEETKNATS